MKKKKSLFLKIFSLLMIFCMSFIFVGCTKSKEDKNTDVDDSEIEGELGDEFDDEFLDEMSLPMRGARVLYREENYFGEGGSGAQAGQNLDYYSEYAYVVLQALYYTYGIVNSSYAPVYLGLGEDMTKYSEIEPYLYDSIRYQVDTVGTVTHTKTQGASTTTPLNENSYSIVGADTTAGWNWKFNFDYMIGSRSSAINQATLTASEGSNRIVLQNSYNTMIRAIYENNEFSLGYQNSYLGTDNPENVEGYSDLVRALEYAIYCYALGAEPAEVTVTPNNSVENGYTVDINGDSVKDALTKIKDSFNKNASFVGLTTRQMTKLKNWICQEVIGVNAANNKDKFLTYNSVVEITDSEGNVVGYELGNPVDPDATLGRNYKDAVSIIVNEVCKQVPIGRPDGETSGGTIDDKFLSSRIKDYAGDNFMVTEDEHLSEANGIPAAEYQSVVLKLLDETTVEGIEIALKYDADLDGVQEGVWDKNKYLDIIVELNYYHAASGQMYVVGSEQARVYDGPFDPHYDGDNREMQKLVDEMYNGEIGGNVLFFDYKAAVRKQIEQETAAGGTNIPTMEAFEKLLDDEEAITLGGFSDFGGGAFDAAKTAEGLLLVGSSPARRYYELVENQPNEMFNVGGEDRMMAYTTGRLNKSVMASDPDKCDYLEVVYKVLRDPDDMKPGSANNSKNYKFYTGIYWAY